MASLIENLISVLEQEHSEYETLLEFVFGEGNLVNCLDHSNMAEKLREDLKSNQNPKTTVTREDIEAFIEESFSLDMETKTWWI